MRTLVEMKMFFFRRYKTALSCYSMYINPGFMAENSSEYHQQLSSRALPFCENGAAIRLSSCVVPAEGHLHFDTFGVCANFDWCELDIFDLRIWDVGHATFGVDY